MSSLPMSMPTSEPDVRGPRMRFVTMFAPALAPQMVPQPEMPPSRKRKASFGNDRYGSPTFSRSCPNTALTTAAPQKTRYHSAYAMSALLCGSSLTYGHGHFSVGP